MIVQIAIVEDERPTAENLKSYLIRYGTENDIHFEIDILNNAILLLENYKPKYDIIFMDIQMPYLNGMDAARQLRKLDSSVLLIFVTNLAQYAISGYEVEALDYIIKPVNYYDFALKLGRAVHRIPAPSQPDIIVSTQIGMIRLNLNDIQYLEVLGHKLIYHTASRTYTQYGTLSQMESRLRPHGFVRCNNCYLVNLRYVTGIKGYTANLGDIQLKISQPRKKTFLASLEEYHQKHIC